MAHSSDTATGTGSGDPNRTLADKMVDGAREQIDRVGHDAEQFAGDAMRKAREAGAKAQDLASQFRPAVERSLKDQPMTTLAGAAVVGFLLGALWKR